LTCSDNATLIYNSVRESAGLSYSKPVSIDVSERIIDITNPIENTVNFGDITLHYTDWGGQGRDLVLVHGLASTLHIWDLVAPLLANNFHVIALDQRGHGESCKPDNGYDFETVSTDLHCFINAIGLQDPVLVGHSWGADVVLQYGSSYNDSAGAIVLVDGGFLELKSVPDLSLDKAKNIMAPPDFRGTGVGEFIGMIKSRSDELNITDKITEIVLANFEISDNVIVNARLDRENHMQIIEAFWNHQPRDLYPAIKCPVLLMPTRQSGPKNSYSSLKFDKEMSINLATELLQNSELVWMEDSIHDVPLQRPELVVKTIVQSLE